MSTFTVTRRLAPSLRLVRLPTKLRLLHEVSFLVRPRPVVIVAPLFRGARARKPTTAHT